MHFKRHIWTGNQSLSKKGQINFFLWDLLHGDNGYFVFFTFRAAVYTIFDVDQNKLDKSSLFDSVIIFTYYGQDRVKIDDFEFFGFFNPMPFDRKISFGFLHF